MKPVFHPLLNASRRQMAPKRAQKRTPKRHQKRIENMKVGGNLSLQKNGKRVTYLYNLRRNSTEDARILAWMLKS